jgi:hypothetical protein
LFDVPEDCEAKWLLQTFREVSPLLLSLGLKLGVVNFFVCYIYFTCPKPSNGLIQKPSFSS